MVGKRTTRRACINCRNAHTRCEENRPCQRCKKLDMEDSCVNPEPRKRGRSRKWHVFKPPHNGTSSSSSSSSTSTSTSTSTSPSKDSSSSLFPIASTSSSTEEHPSALPTPSPSPSPSSTPISVEPISSSSPNPSTPSHGQYYRVPEQSHNEDRVRNSSSRSYSYPENTPAAIPNTSPRSHPFFPSVGSPPSPLNTSPSSDTAPLPSASSSPSRMHQGESQAAFAVLSERVEGPRPPDRTIATPRLSAQMLNELREVYEQSHQMQQPSPSGPATSYSSGPDLGQLRHSDTTTLPPHRTGHERP